MSYSHRAQSSVEESDGEFGEGGAYSRPGTGTGGTGTGSGLPLGYPTFNGSGSLPLSSLHARQRSGSASQVLSHSRSGSLRSARYAENNRSSPSQNHHAPPVTIATSTSNNFLNNNNGREPPHSAPPVTSTTHAGGIQPSASFFHPSRPLHTVLPIGISDAVARPRPLSIGSDVASSLARTSITDDVSRHPRSKMSHKALLPIGGGGSSMGLYNINTGTAPAGPSRPKLSPIVSANSSGGRVRNSLEKLFRRTLSVDSNIKARFSLERKSNAEDRSPIDNNGPHIELKDVPTDEESMFPSPLPKTPVTPIKLAPPILPANSPAAPNKVKSDQFNPLRLSSAEDLAAVPVMDPKTGKPTRRYRIHPSSNKFFFNGRIIAGGDSPLPFIASLVAALGIAGAWLGTTAVWWWHNESPAVTIVGVYLILVALTNMLMTAFTDPGILPRELDPDPPFSQDTPESEEGSPRVPLPRDLSIRTGVVRVKYCSTCHIYRPPRSSHCRLCDNCVDGCDHHCQWLNNCVGRRNYTSFIAFLSFAVITLCYTIVTSALTIYLQTRRDHISAGQSLQRAPGSAVVFCLAIVIVWPVGGLLGYHTRLLLLNLTTIEQIRNSAHKSLGHGAPPPNPFALANWQHNLAEMLCRPQGMSWLDATAIATDDKREVNPGAMPEEQDELQLRQ